MTTTTPAFYPFACTITSWSPACPILASILANIHAGPARSAFPNSTLPPLKTQRSHRGPNLNKTEPRNRHARRTTIEFETYNAGRFMNKPRQATIIRKLANYDMDDNLLNSSIICIQETHITTDKPGAICTEIRDKYHTHSQTGIHGAPGMVGLLTCISKDLGIPVRIEPLYQSALTSAVELEAATDQEAATTLYVVNYYIAHPHSNLCGEQAIIDLAKTIAAIYATNPDPLIIVAGDANLKPEAFDTRSTRAVSPLLT